jgi:acetyl-CoA carboxylase biotin carboxyl carrier protein
MKTKEIEELIEFIAKSGLEEVRIETDQIKLSVKKNAPFIQQTAPALPSSSLQATRFPISIDAAHSEAASSYIEFKAPIVGTFYQAPDPDAPPFVQVGDRIQKGQKLCVIEAMKLFNEIEADIAGTLVKVLVDDAAPVEYDQPLFLIDPQ